MTVVEWQASADPPAMIRWLEVDADDAEFDLTLPPAFLLACGRLGLPIELYTNE
jgi:hypothetical protein